VIKFEKTAHWYSKDRKAQHDADLRVARKQLLYPSVTTINKDTFKNDFLDRWKMNELVAAAADNFKQPHESPEDYANRLYELSRSKATDAADFGKRIHKAIEDYPIFPSDAALHPWVHKFGEWRDAHMGDVLHREEILLDHDIGVAGCCDCIAHGKGPFDGQLIVPDWKTQNVKADKKGRKQAAFYEDWPRQLAFYAVAYSKRSGMFPDLPVCLSVVIDSNAAETPSVRVWKREEIVDNYKDFVAGAYLWFSKRDYWPVGRWSPTFPFSMP
jgi:hypothetical protein